MTCILVQGVYSMSHKCWIVMVGEMKLAYSIFKSDLQNDEFQEFALN